MQSAIGGLPGGQVRQIVDTADGTNCAGRQRGSRGRRRYGVGAKRAGVDAARVARLSFPFAVVMETDNSVINWPVLYYEKTARSLHAVLLQACLMMMMQIRNFH